MQKYYRIASIYLIIFNESAISKMMSVTFPTEHTGTS